MTTQRFTSAAKDKLFFSKYLGIEFVAFREGYCRCELALRPELLNRLGLLHGGVTYTLADTCMGGAVFSLLHDDQHCLTIEAKTNYLRPVTEGTLVAESRVVLNTQRVAVVTCEVHDGLGNMIALVTGSFYITAVREAASRGAA